MNLKIVRKIKDLSQQDVSDILGIPPRTIRNWENGEREAPAYLIKLIEDKLLSMTEEEIEYEKKFAVVELSEDMKKITMFVGSREECVEYKNDREKKTKPGYCSICKLSEYEKNKKYITELIEYSQTLSAVEKKNTVKIGKEDYPKFKLDFAQEYYNKEGNRKMGFTNSDGREISYDCSDLIKELKQDIAEFGGDMIVEVVTEEVQGVTIYKDYNFIDKDDTEHEFTLTPTEQMQRMTATALLILYKKENEIM